jgi:hypothetical protein
MRFVRAFLLFFSAAIIFSLTGCAGTQFARVADPDLQLGSTTVAQIMAKLGKPFQEASGSSNGQPTRTLSYAYAGAGMQAKTTGITPVKAQVFVFHNDRLVSYQYVANLKDDHTDFDDSKIKQIEQGKTSATQVRQLLGNPSGQSIYPMVKQPNSRGMSYEYTEMRGLTPSVKKAKIVVDTAGMVLDVDYSTQGNWGK